MATVTFDNLKFSRKLETGGVPREQAMVIAEAVAEVQAENLGELATKAEIKAELRELELRMTIKFGGAVIAAVGIILAAMRFMLKGM